MNQKWKKPKDEHIVYEGLSAIADGRIEWIDANTAKCTSTSRGKFYTITYDPATNSIMSNDNVAYYLAEVSYPILAMLLDKGLFQYDQTILQHLQNIAWKDINQKNKNDYMKSVRQVLADLQARGVDTDTIQREAQKIYDWVCSLKLNLLGTKVAPPKAY